MTQLVRVGRIENAGTTQVDVLLRAPCEGCALGCGLGSRGVRRLTGLPAPAGARPGAALVPGARVRVLVERSGLSRAAAVVFGVPIGCCVAAAELGSAWAGDAGGVAAALVALPVAGFVVTFAAAALSRWVTPELVAASDEISGGISDEFSG